MDNKNYGHRESHLNELYSKSYYIFGLLENAYEHKYIKDWKYTETTWHKIYKQKQKDIIKKHKPERPHHENYVNPVMDGRIHSFFFKRLPEIRFLQIWLDDLIELTPYLSLKDMAFSEGLRHAYGNIEIERKEERQNVLQQLKKALSYLTSLIEDPKIIDQMLIDKKSLKQTLLNDSMAAKIINDSPTIEKMVDAFSESLDYAKESFYNGNPDIGKNSKLASDKFAEDLTEDLSKVRKEGCTSTRAIAERFNELNIKTARGGNWHHNSIAVILRRRKVLGLDTQEGNEPEPPTAD